MITKDLGMVTAYAYAVSKGYTGTETEFAELMASYATVAQEAVDAALAAAQSAQSARDAQTAAEGARDTAQTTVSGAIAGIQAEGQTQIGVVQSEGTAQVGNVNSAGQTQVGNVNAAGANQVDAVQAKGAEVLDSIPSDYTALSGEVSGLKSAYNYTKNNLHIYAIDGTEVSGETQYGYAIFTNKWKIVNTTSTSWIQKKYAVSKGEEYSIKATLSLQAADVAAIYFTTEFTVGQVVDCIKPSQDATVEIFYTAHDDGYIVILGTVGVNTRATDMHVSPVIYKDFQPEIDAINARLKYGLSNIPYVARNGLVSSETGDVSTSSSSYYVELDLTGKSFDSLSFKINPYSGNYGYGFLLSDNTWIGTRTIAAETITVSVPENAVKFKTCWSANYYSQTGQEINATINATAQELVTMINNVESVPTYNYPLDLSIKLGNVANAEIVTPTAYNVQTDIYSRYDAFVTSNPEWCEKIDCAEGATALGITAPAYLSGMPIYLYKFVPKRTSESESTKRIKVMIVTGVHPNELMDFFTVNQFFNFINTAWKTDDTVAQLRSMVDFYVMPCVSPWGYANHSRVNGNGVNLNRNFPTLNWAASGSGTEDYTGATAGSEYETKLVMYYADQIKPDIFYDAHTGGMTASGRYGCINIDISAPANVYTNCIAYTMSLVREWIANNADFPQKIDDSPLFSCTKAQTVGTAYRWASENITDFSFLTEESVINNWVNGELMSTTQEINTQRIWNENLKAVYGAILWAIKGKACNFVK